MSRKPVSRPEVNQARRRYMGQVIRKYRIMASMEQAELASRLGVTKSAVGNWELGFSRPDLDTLPTLCAVLHVPVAELLQMHPEIAPDPAQDIQMLEKIRRLSENDRRILSTVIERLLLGTKKKAGSAR